MQPPEPLCVTCAHWLAEEFDGFRCAAFPDSIPAAILESRVDHRMSYPGDNGITYEPKGASDD